MEIYEISVCPEHRSPASQQWVHEPSGGAAVRRWMCNRHGHVIADADVLTIEVVPKAETDAKLAHLQSEIDYLVNG